MNMNRSILITLLVLFLVSCGNASIPPEPQAPEPSRTPAQQTVQVIPAVTPTGVPPAPSGLSPDGKKLRAQIKIADEKLNSYQYFYSDRRPDSNYKFPIWGFFKVKGDRIRLDITPVEELSARLAGMGNTDRSLYQPNLYGDDYYNQFFLNMATQKAYARCDNSLCRNRAQIAPVRFEDFYRKTPMDWRREIPLETVRIIDSKQIQGQSIIRVIYERDGEQITQWLEQYAMLPIRVDIGDPEDDGYTIHFLDFAPNSVSDTEFEGVPI